MSERECEDRNESLIHSGNSKVAKTSSRSQDVNSDNEISLTTTTSITTTTSRRDAKEIQLNSPLDNKSRRRDGQEENLIVSTSRTTTTTTTSDPPYSDPSKSSKELEPEPAVRRKPKKVAKVKPNPRNVETLGLTLVENHRSLGDGPGLSTTRPLTPISKVSSLTPTPHPTTPSPIFESGVNTEYIQLLRQLWNVHEEAVEFLGRLTYLLTQCRRRVRLNHANEEGRRKKSLGSRPSTSHTTNHSKRKEDLTPVEPLAEGSAIQFLLEETDSWPALLPFIQGLRAIVESVGDMEKQFLALSVFQSQCKLVLYAKVN